MKSIVPDKKVIYFRSDATQRNIKIKRFFLFSTVFLMRTWKGRYGILLRQDKNNVADNIHFFIKYSSDTQCRISKNRKERRGEANTSNNVTTYSLQ